MADSSEQPPLLHEIDLMLAVLKTGESGPIKLDQCLHHVRDNLHAAHVDSVVDEGELRERLAKAFYKLEKARCVELCVGETFRTTARGRLTLRSHPMGVDDSVLMQYPEFADFIEKLSQRRPPEDVGAIEYEQGYDAYTAGRNYTDNPYSDDTARYMAWENGWFQAFDERSDIEPE